MFKWLKDVLFQRTARVKLDNKFSNQVKIREGVPQGDVISSTQFFVYLNDLVTTLPKHVHNTLHADGIAGWSTESNTALARNRIRNTTQNVSDWADK